MKAIYNYFYHERKITIVNQLFLSLYITGSCLLCEETATCAYLYYVGAIHFIKKYLQNSDQHSIQQCINKALFFNIIDIIFEKKNELNLLLSLHHSRNEPRNCQLTAMKELHSNQSKTRCTNGKVPSPLTNKKVNTTIHVSAT